MVFRINIYFLYDFPFFFYFLKKKKRAWFITLIAAIMNFVSTYYFDVGRINMFYSFIFFCVGGLIYLYKDDIIKILNKSRIVSFLLLLISICIFFVMPKDDALFTIRILPMSIMLVAYAISFDSKVLDNKFTSFISSISLEIYLCHMVIFRIVEKLKLTHIVNNNLLSYIITFIGVTIGAITFAYVFRLVLKKISERRRNNESIISK